MRYFTLFLLTIFTFNTFAITPSIEDFREERTTLDAELSPSGRYLALLKNNGQKREVMIHDLHNQGNLVSQFGDEVVRPFNLNWISDEKILVSIISPVFRNQVKSELEDKHIREIDYPYVTRIVSITMGKSGWVELLGKKSSLGLSGNLSNIENILPDDEDNVLLSAWAEGKYKLYKANVNTGKGEVVASGNRNTYNFISNRNGEIRYRLDYVRSQKEIIILAKNGKNWLEVDRIYFDNEEAERNGGIKREDFSGITHDGSLLYLKRNPDTGFYALFKRNNQKEIELFREEKGQDILGIDKNTYTSEVTGYFTVNNEAIIEASWDKEQQQHIDNIKEQLEDIGTSGFSIRWRKNDAPTLIVRGKGLSNPGIYYIYNKKSGKLNYLAPANEFLPSEKLAISAKVKYKARDGQLISALLLIPRNFKQGQPHPTVVLPHGGPNARDYDVYDPIAQFIATRGYIVIKPNFRGSTGYGKEFEEAGYKQWGALMQDDVEDAAHFLVKNGLSDQNKICIAGISYGGYAALMGSLHQEKLFKCAISINGVTDLLGIIDNTETNLKKINAEQQIDKLLYQRIGHPEHDKAMLKQQSPVYRANDVQVPILLIGGEKDKIVPFEQQEDMHDALKDAKKDVEFIEFEEGRHNPIRNYEDIKPFYEAVESFLKKHLT